jgi:hypothetical protein
MHATFFHQI